MSNDNPPPPLLPTPQKSKKKGCLIGCAIAAGIGMFFVIPILAAALFPAVSAAILSARATAMKQQSRSIWTAITSANHDRIGAGLPLLWPGDLAQHGITFTFAEEYFTYLMSDGVNTTVIEPNPDKRLVPDLHPARFAGPGVTSAPVGGPLLPENNAWHVVVVYNGSSASTPFLISRNARASDFSQVLRAVEGDNALVAMNPSVKPFGQNVAVWVTRGGSTIDARRRLFTRKLICSEGEPPLTVLPAQGGFR